MLTMGNVCLFASSRNTYLHKRCTAINDYNVLPFRLRIMICRRRIEKTVRGSCCLTREKTWIVCYVQDFRLVYDFLFFFFFFYTQTTLSTMSRCIVRARTSIMWKPRWSFSFHEFRATFFFHRRNRIVKNGKDTSDSKCEITKKTF